MDNNRVIAFIQRLEKSLPTIMKNSGKTRQTSVQQNPCQTVSATITKKQF